MASNYQNMSTKLRLPMYLDKFIEDFSFADISNDLDQADRIFTDTELKRIKDIDNSEQQIIQMFFFLCEKSESIVDRFINILDKCYHWLVVESISLNQLNHEERLYIDLYERLGKVEPKHEDINVHRLNYVSIFSVLNNYGTHIIQN